MLPPVSELEALDAPLVAAAAAQILLLLEEAVRQRRPGTDEVWLSVPPRAPLWGTAENPSAAFLNRVAALLTEQVQALGYQGVHFNFGPMMVQLYQVVDPYVGVTLRIFPKAEKSPYDLW